MEVDGFIVIGPGLWYCTETGCPFSSKKQIGIGGGSITRYDGELKPLHGINSKGYYTVWINSKCQLWHRVVYEHFLGPIPKGMQIDHIDGNKLDNRIDNLRLATPRQNMMNRDKLKIENITSSHKGVYLDKRRGKWRAEMKKNGIKTNLGSFNTEEEAAKAYQDAASLYQGEFKFQ
jgi:hypothetical protein